MLSYHSIRNIARCYTYHSDVSKHLIINHASQNQKEEGAKAFLTPNTIPFIRWLSATKTSTS
ncbi:hypothetical protein JCM15765_19340 [Paradesulfitobacterium aromaticivorans]